VSDGTDTGALPRPLPPLGENRIKVGFLSLTGASPTGDDRPYLAWHQLDHMPEQYRLPGMVLGQRWASTPACRRARATETEGWSSVEHAVCYMMGEPVDRTVDDFIALGGELAKVGRYPHVMPSQYRGALRLVETMAAPRVLVSPEVVPFRPHRGVYLFVEQPERTTPSASASEDGLGRLPAAALQHLVDVPGVAGAWVYATSPDLRRPMFTEGILRVTICYLDEEPVTVADRLASTLDRVWDAVPTRLLLAAPFESIVRWDWEGVANAAT
jgi:hypothetical protein